MSGGLAGALTERVTLLIRDDARDALGAAAGGWRDDEAIWAAVRPARPRDDEIGPVSGWRVTIRSGLGVRPGDRLRWDATTMRVRMTVFDPATPDRLLLETEAVR